MSSSVVRTKSSHEKVLYQWNRARSTRWVTPPDGTSVLEIQTTHRPSDFLDLPDDKNILVPPYHWHWGQTEYFDIKRGRYIFTLEGKSFTVSASDPQPTVIPAAARHTFKVDPTCREECEIGISTSLSPAGKAADDAGASEKFFRNIYSYSEDCHAQKKEPSIPQMLLFLHSAEVSLAFPWGPDWLMRWVTYSMGLVGGVWIGQGLLGYKASYEEYYDEKLKWQGDDVDVGKGTGLKVQGGEGQATKRK